MSQEKCSDTIVMSQVWCADLNTLILYFYLNNSEILIGSHKAFSDWEKQGFILENFAEDKSD